MRNSFHMFARRATHKFLRFGKANTRDKSAHRFIYLSSYNTAHEEVRTPTRFNIHFIHRYFKTTPLANFSVHFFTRNFKKIFFSNAFFLYERFLKKKKEK